MGVLKTLLLTARLITERETNDKKKKIPLVRPSKVEVIGNILFGVNMTE